MSLPRILRNVFSNYIASAVGRLTGLVVTPIVFHHLGATDYATLTFALATLGIIQFLDLGVFRSLVHYVSSLAERQEHTELRELASTSFYAGLGLGALSSAVLVALGPFLARFFRIPSSAAASAVLVINVIGLSLPFILSAATLEAYLHGCQDFHLGNLVDAAYRIVVAAATVAVLWMGYGLPAIAAIQLAGSLLWLGSLLWITGRGSVPFRPRPGEFRLSAFGRIWRFVSAAFVEETARSSFLQLDLLLCARFLPFQEVAILAIARKFPAVLVEFCARGIGTIHPVLSSASARQERDSFIRFVVVGTRTTIAALVPALGALYVWADVFLRLWVGAEVLPGVPALRVLLLFAAFGGAYWIPLMVLYGLGRATLSAAVTSSMLVGGALLGSWLAQRAGLVGLAWGFAAVQGLGTVFLFGRAMQLLEIRVIQLWTGSIAPLLLPGAVALIWLPLSYRILPHGWLGMGASAAAAFLVFGTVFVASFQAASTEGWIHRSKRLLTEIE